MGAVATEPDASTTAEEPTAALEVVATQEVAFEPLTDEQEVVVANDRGPQPRRVSLRRRLEG